jgi:hypothetical protein
MVILFVRSMDPTTCVIDTHNVNRFIKNVVVARQYFNTTPPRVEHGVG